ncbi:hypothetical protein JR316_0012756 [Psilocybe cubensis]|uniref:Uncharacterized protein n=2 Tax=Psilocybe cubensis TaxID=181762 RepID=A0A8H8CHP5_PSICU|nr:hypothetical protein JR316_0012756 [Psilocybe cubensis]KAH9474298.1 hypothetical protein JR316_0012756 [Psilocybe cubensis]
MPVLLPIELIDHIIHQAVHTAQSHPKGTSSIALISHRYRTMLYRERFSSVAFMDWPTDYNKDKFTYRILGLAKLVAESIQYPRMRGVHTFITSFSLIAWPYREILNDTSQISQSLITILDNLFRDPSSLSSIPYRTLTLRTPHGWPKNKALAASLRSMIKTSHINALCVDDDSHLPSDIILGCNIEHLTIKRGFCLDRKFKSGAHNSYFNPVPLKSLTITGVYESEFVFHNITMVICGQNFPAPDMFAHLTTLAIYKSFPDLIACVVNNTNILESLTIQFLQRLLPCDAAKIPRIHFKSLQHLKALNISYLRKIDKETPPITPIAFFQHEDPPPLLEKFTLKITLVNSFPPPFRSPEDDLNSAIQEKHEISQWDRYLSSLKPLCNLHTITVDLLIRRLVCFPGEIQCYPSWSDTWCPYFSDAFVKCNRVYKAVHVTVRADTILHAKVKNPEYFYRAFCKLR